MKIRISDKFNSNDKGVIIQFDRRTIEFDGDVNFYYKGKFVKRIIPFYEKIEIVK